MSACILLIEDNAANSDLMTYLLRAFGYEVDCASDGATGLEKARSKDYGLVLTDILMPQMDGYEFLSRFRSDPALNGVPLIAVTALAMAGDREKILAHGFDGYIAKPIDPQHFGAQISGFLNGRTRGKNSDR